MITRLYVHNFRCLENFELTFGGGPSTLLIGRNGSGKSTVGVVLGILQQIARGTSRVSDLLRPSDIVGKGIDTFVRFEIEATIEHQHYKYSLALYLLPEFRDLGVSEEELTIEGLSFFSRVKSKTQIGSASIDLPPQTLALSLLGEPLAFTPWLASVLLLKPVPSMTRGGSENGTLRPDTTVANTGAWFSGMSAASPASYLKIKHHLIEVMPDFLEITNPLVGKEARSLLFHFGDDHRRTTFSLEDLSDGERCFVILALTIAANAAYGPLLCFWDEPDNFLAPSEVGHAVMALRRAFQDRGQLIITSHNPEAIRCFSDENTLVLDRKSHMEPTVIRSVASLRGAKQFEGSFVNALLRGDIEA